MNHNGLNNQNEGILRLSAAEEKIAKDSLKELFNLLKAKNGLNQRGDVVEVDLLKAALYFYNVHELNPYFYKSVEMAYPNEGAEISLAEFEKLFYREDYFIRKPTPVEAMNLFEALDTQRNGMINADDFELLLQEQYFYRKEGFGPETIYKADRGKMPALPPELEEEF